MKYALTGLIGLLLWLPLPVLATETEDEENPTLEATEEQATPLANDPLPPAAPLSLLGASVEPASFNTLYWSPEQTFASIATPVPVLVAHGRRPGPVLCITAAVHGDELNGIEMVRRLMFDLEPEDMSGSVIGVPIVNLDGFRRGERYLSDRRDLNRHFPGNSQGSAASRLAHSLFAGVIVHCNYLIDLHTGSMARTNLPQIRGNLRDSAIVELAKHLGGITVLHNRGAPGTLRRAATDRNIPTLTLEAGGPNVLEERAVNYGVNALETLLDNLGIRESSRFWSAPQPVFYESSWVRSSQGGILLSKVKLGDKVKAGDVLGTVIDPVSNTGSAILAPFNGKLLGMAENQVVQTGYAAYHLGVERKTEEVEQEAEADTEETGNKKNESESYLPPESVTNDNSSED